MNGARLNRSLLLPEVVAPFQSNRKNRHLRLLRELEAARLEIAHLAALAPRPLRENHQGKPFLHQGRRLVQRLNGRPGISPLQKQRTSVVNRLCQRT